MTDAINPKHYQFSNGTQLIDITENLNGNGAQAVQYITRATRLDGRNKADTVDGLVEDLKKARWFVDREIGRLNGVATVRADSGSGDPLVRDWREMSGYTVYQDRDGDYWRTRLVELRVVLEYSSTGEFWAEWPESNYYEVNDYGPFVPVATDDEEEF